MDVVGGSWRSDLRLTSEGADQDWRQDSGDTHRRACALQGRNGEANR